MSVDCSLINYLEVGQVHGNLPADMGIQGQTWHHSQVRDMLIEQDGAHVWRGAQP